MPLIRTSVTIPLRDNSGRLFPRTLWEALESRYLVYGGFTRTPRVVGVWRTGTRTYRDQSRQYIVGLASWLQLPGWLDTVRWAQATFLQEAMYIEVAGIPEVVSAAVQS